MIVIVTGGRNNYDYRFIELSLQNLHMQYDFKLLCHGDAPGVDRIAGQWALYQGLAVRPYPADWDTHGKKAGPIRNSFMLKAANPDMVVAFRGNWGTDDMVLKTKAAGVALVDLREQGT